MPRSWSKNRRRRRVAESRGELREADQPQADDGDVSHLAPRALVERLNRSARARLAIATRPVFGTGTLAHGRHAIVLRLGAPLGFPERSDAGRRVLATDELRDGRLENVRIDGLLLLKEHPRDRRREIPRGLKALLPIARERTHDDGFDVRRDVASVEAPGARPGRRERCRVAPRLRPRRASDDP